MELLNGGLMVIDVYWFLSDNNQEFPLFYQTSPGVPVATFDYQRVIWGIYGDYPLVN